MSEPPESAEPTAEVDLNADLGEGFANDARLLELVTSASLACGAHAGDEATASAALRLAAGRGVAVGAHPGYPDREGFGRVERSASAVEVERWIHDQFRWLERLAAHAGVVLRFVKPHGALYNQAQKDAEIARGVVRAVRGLGLPVLGQPGSLLEREARDAGVQYVREGFPERRYQPDGRLVPRTRPDAVLHDPAEVESQVVRLVAEGLDTLCIHGDDPRAVANAETVRSYLERHAIRARFWAEG